MVRCQLEQLSERVIVSNSFPVGDDEWMFFGVVDRRVERLEFELKSGPNLRVDLVDPPNTAFKVFAVALTQQKGSMLKRPILTDASGQVVKPLKRD